MFLLLILSFITHASVSGEVAELHNPSKKSYKLAGTNYNELYQTGKFADSYSMICNMGQALQDPKKPDWYINKPIQGLKFELRARAAFIDFNKQVKPMGFVLVTKNNDTLITFKPLGDIVESKWDGDVFSSWSGTETDIKVYSERFGKSGYAYFDLLDGNGFFYKSDKRESPDYFLSDCKRIKKEKLPVYDWK